MFTRRIALTLAGTAAAFFAVGAVSSAQTVSHPTGVVHVATAETAARQVSKETGRTCWAEVNHSMPEGYEVICPS